MEICRRTWLTDDGRGGRREFVLALELPREGEGHWRCEVAIDGRRHGMFGHDSWQAVDLAQRFVRMELADLMRRGVALYWLDGTPVDPASLDKF